LTAIVSSIILRISSRTAREEGADVLILEKQPEQSHHTNTSMARGGFLCPSDVKGGIKYLEALCQAGEGMYWTEKDMIRVWIEYTAGNRAWLEARGGSFLETPIAAEYPQLPGCESMVRYHFRGSGLGFAKFLSEQVKGRNIPVMYDSAATKLLTDLKGQVVGVEAENRTDGKTKQIRVRAAKGVILTCGGFEFNEAMKLNYLKVYPTYFTGSEANTGDGIKMALGVGADLWHMNCVSAHTVMKFPGFPNAFYAALVPGPGPSPHSEAGKVDPAQQCGYVVTDRYGRRIINEDNFRATPPGHTYYYELAFFDSQRLVYPRVPSYWIFDRKRVEMGPLPRHAFGVTGPSRLYEWSKDNSHEIAKGWVLTANTIRDLARVLEMSPDILEDTIAKYNRYCEKGSDPDFGRGSVDLIPIEQPPYFAVKLWPGGANTQGGPKRNTKAEVLNTDGEPIPGLYSAGELGAIFGMLYPGAGSLADCVAFGRIAGKSAADRGKGTR
jgi:succinate dehydrogenase/fumarate reductase flavoprotein subunit